MKKHLGIDIDGTYTFNPVAKTVTISGLSDPISIGNILVINNATANTLIYNFADSARGAVSFTNNVLTLDFDTSAMGATDELQIFLDLDNNDLEIQAVLRRLLKVLESNSTVDRWQRQKIVIEAVGNAQGTPTEAAGAIPVTGTVTAVSSGTYNVSNGIASQATPNSAVNPYTLGSQTTGSIMEGPVHQLWRVASDAQTCYASAIRSKLTF